MSMHDAQVALVSAGDMAVAVVGRGENFALIRMDGDINAAIEAARAEAEKKGQEYIFCGVMGMVNGIATARREPGLDAMRVVEAAFLSYARMVVDELKVRQRDDSLEWLEDLYALPDTRTEP